MASQRALLSRTCCTSYLGSSRSFSTSSGLCAAAQVRWGWLNEHHSLTSCNARRSRDPHTGIRPHLPFLSRRQVPGHSPQSIYNRSVPGGILKTRNEAERALGSRVLAPFRILVICLKDDLETETIFSDNQRGGHHPRGTLIHHRTRALRRSKNLSKALFAEMPKDE